MLIEPAIADDLEPLFALIHRAYRGDSARSGWTHESDLLDGMRTDRETLAEMLTDPRRCMLVARDGEEIVGCIALTDMDEGLAYVGMVTVDPLRQSAGLGRRLLEAVEGKARERFGAVRAEMTVISRRRELIAWYQRRGYALTGERRPFPASDPRFGLPKRDDLEFVVLEKRL